MQRDTLELQADRDPDGVDRAAERVEVFLVDEDGPRETVEGDLDRGTPGGIRGSDVDELGHERQLFGIESGRLGEGEPRPVESIGDRAVTAATRGSSNPCTASVSRLTRTTKTASTNATACTTG